MRIWIWSLATALIAVGCSSTGGSSAPQAAGPDATPAAAPAAKGAPALPQQPLQVHTLLSQRCAAQGNGRLSSLVVAGRDRLPVEPGGWLISPMTVIADEGLPRPAGQVPSLPAVPSRRARAYAESSPGNPHSLLRHDVSGWAAGCGS